MSDITILNEIKLLASELSNMSPKTQMEIVKLCKNLCLKTKDYLVDLDENTINEINENISEIETNLSNEILRATGKENEIAGNLASEILRATGAENGLDTRITNLKNMFGFIEITNTTGTLTDEQYAEALKPYCIICLSNTNFYYKEKYVNNIITFSQFEIGNYSTYWRLGETNINVLQDKTYQLNNTSLKTDMYSTTQTDALLNGKQNALEFNPTIPSGTTPTPLSNLKDGNNYYSLGGGNQLYRHTFQVGVKNYDYIVVFDVISSQSTPVSDNFSSLKSFLDNTFTLPSCNCGAFYNSNEKVYPAYLVFDSSTTITMTWTDNLPGNVVSVKSVDITSSNIDFVEDEVTTI